MRKVELSLALSSRGRARLRMSMEELLTSLSQTLLSTSMTPRPGIYSVQLGKIWVSDGADHTEISATLSLRLDSQPICSAKRAAIAAAFS